MGVESIQPRLLKEVASETAGPLIMIYNNSLTSTSLPTGGIPLQNVINFCCSIGRVPTVGGATTAKVEPHCNTFLTK